MEPFIQELNTLGRLLNLPDYSVSGHHDEEIHLEIVSFNSKTFKKLTDRDHELSRSLGTLVRLIVEHRGLSTFSIVVDINGVEQKLINEAKSRADIAYRRVLQYHKRYEFGYLNPFERMIIHSFLKEKPEVLTESHGEGSERRLTVVPQI